MDLSKWTPRRDQWGRPLITPPTGGKPVAYRRPSTIAKAISDTSNLAQWKMRMVALGLGKRPDLFALAQTAKPDDRRTLDRLCDDALSAAQAEAAANNGTAAHAVTEAWDRGEYASIDDAPQQFQALLNAYSAALAAHSMTVMPGMVEVTVVDHLNKLCGTFDRVLERDGRRYIADLKTGKSTEYGGLEWSMQLAIYADASARFDDRGAEQPMPDVDKDYGVIIHAPIETGVVTLHWIDLSVGRDALPFALGIEALRKRGKGTITRLDEPDDVSDVEPLVGPDADIAALAPAAEGRRAWVNVRMVAIRANADALATLANRWPGELRTLKAAGDTITDAEIDQIAVMLDGVEKDHSLPFGTPDPATPAPKQPAFLAPVEPREEVAPVAKQGTSAERNQAVYQAADDASTPMSAEDATALVRLIMSTHADTVGLQWILETVAVAKADGMAIGVTARPTKRRHNLMRTLHLVASATTDDHAALLVALLDVVDPDTARVDAVTRLACLPDMQATQIAAIADQIVAGHAEVSVADDGTLRIAA
jgi:hypothetical protein